MARNTEKNAKDYNKAARLKYIKENCKMVRLTCNLNDDNDNRIIEHLSLKKNRTDYIRNLILNDIQNR